MTKKKSNGFLDEISIEDIKDFLSACNEDKLSEKDFFEMTILDDGVNVTLYQINSRGKRFDMCGVTIHEYGLSVQVPSNTYTYDKYGVEGFKEQLFKYLITKYGKEFVDKYITRFRKHLISQANNAEVALDGLLGTITESTFSKQNVKTIKDKTQTIVAKTMTELTCDLDAILHEVENEVNLKPGS